MSKVSWSYRLYRLARRGADLIFLPLRGGCKKPGFRWCPVCQNRVQRIVESYCEKCGIPIRGAGLCNHCQNKPPAYRFMRSWAVFDSLVQEALHIIKYRGNASLADSLALQMAGFVQTLQWPVDLVISVPLGRQRLKERDYNQVGLVAHPLAYELELEYASQGLSKQCETRSQVGLNASQRKENVLGAHQTDPSVVKRRPILLMDDVSTTGATIQSCTEA